MIILLSHLVDIANSMIAALIVIYMQNRGKK